MKSRKKIIPTKNPVVERPESKLNKILLENSARKRKFTSISLQQNLDFLHQQNLFFPKPSCPCGDADTYFRRTLRNYDPFDLSVLRTPRPSTQRSVKSTKSLDTLKKRKSTRSCSSSFIPKRRPKTPNAHIRPVAKNRSSVPKLQAFKETSTEAKKENEDLDLDVFYSPGSQTYESSSHTLINKSSGSSFVVEEPTAAVDAVTEPAVVEEPKETTKEEPVIEQSEPEAVGEKKDDQEETPTKMAEESPETPESPEEFEGGEDELQEVEKIIQQASEELVEEISNLNEGESAAKTKGDGDGSFFEFDPEIDAAVLRELEEAEKQAKATAKVIYELKTRVTELLKKEKHTEAEAKELEEKNKELKAQMMLFEEKTKRIQFLIAQTNLFDKMIQPLTPLQTSHKEDMLPKVIVCGMTENNIPKLILCDDKKRKSSCPPECTVPKSVVPKFAKRLSDSYTMQEKLAAENADLEGNRYQLQSDLLNKDQTIEYLQRNLCSIQCEMRMLCKENSVLNEKMAQMCGPNPQMKQKRAPCGKGKGPCPADIENRLNEYSETTRILEQQLMDMECDVKTMQNELSAVQAEREHLEKHKKVIICPPICYPPCGPPCAPAITPSFDQQLREMKEKYCQLQDDFKGKVIEVAGLRADNEKQKAIVKDSDEARKVCEDKVKELERNIRTLKAACGNGASSKEQMIEQEQQLAVAKQRFREAQDELEELRALIQDQQTQMDDYRNKYLEAQQEVEEQKRHIDILDMEANRVSEQVNLDIQRVKSQFQEKLQELLPLPDLLKSTQVKLQETQQMHLLAERNNEALNRDLQIYKDKIAEINAKMESTLNDQEMGEGEKAGLMAKLKELEEKVAELQEENDTLNNNLESTEALLEETKLELDAKLHEIAQLSAQLESVREESARQVARNKERCETVRRSMQNQIFDMERQLAQSRACAKAAQKDRDEIRQKMQSQINNLHENFEDAQMRIRNLQGHVNFLRESVPSDAETKSSSPKDACGCGN